MRDRRRGDPPHGARAGRGGAWLRLRAHRHLHAGVRHARKLARGRAQRAHRQPRPRGRRDVHARRGRPEELLVGRRRPRREVRALDQPRTRPLGAVRRTAGVGPRRGDRHPGSGPGASAHHGGWQPAPVHSEQRPPRGRRREPRLHALDRHLRERDDAARRRGAAGAGAAREGALRPRPLPAGHAQRRELLAGDLRADGPGRVGGVHAHRRRDRRARGRTQTSRCSTTWSSRP